MKRMIKLMDTPTLFSKVRLSAEGRKFKSRLGKKSASLLSKNALVDTQVVIGLSNDFTKCGRIKCSDFQVLLS